MSLFTTITVFAHERALEYVDGVCTRVLAPGRHKTARRATYHRVHVLDQLQVTAQTRQDEGVGRALRPGWGDRCGYPRQFAHLPLREKRHPSDDRSARDAGRPGDEQG